MFEINKEAQLRQMTNELNDLEIRACMLGSQMTKGRTHDESGVETIQAVENLKSEASSRIKHYANIFESAQMSRTAEEVESLRVQIEELERLIEEILESIERVREESRRIYEELTRELQKPVPKVPRVRKLDASGLTRAHLEPLKDKEKEKPKTKGKPKENPQQAAQPANAAEKQASGILKTAGMQKPSQGRAKSNIRYAKTSEAKAKDFANQRALKKPERAMTRSAPAMAPSQMSR